jgi:hypothetical protein
MQTAVERGSVVRRRWPLIVAQAAAGVLFAALIWYALMRIGILREEASQQFDPATIWYEVATGVVGAVAALVFVSPVATLASGLTTVAGIVVVRVGLVGTIGDPGNPTLGYVLYLGGFDRLLLVLSGIWVGAGIILLLRDRSRARRLQRYRFGARIGSMGR